MKRLAAVGGVITAFSVCAVAAATPSLAARAIFTSKAVPATGVKNGTVIKDTGTGALKSTQYVCTQVIINPTTQVYAVLGSSVKVVKSSAVGKVVCKQTFKGWSGTDTKNVLRHCPLTAADKTAKFVCGIALGDIATSGNASASLAIFKTG
jgi:hypothetical protein